MDADSKQQSSKEKNVPAARLHGSFSKFEDRPIVLISQVDEDMRYTFVNEDYETFFDLDKSEIIGKEIVEIIGEEIFAKARSFFLKSLKGEHISLRTRFYDIDGESRNMFVNHIPVKGENNLAKGFIIIIIDESFFEKARRDDLDREKMIFAFFKKSGDPMFVLKEYQVVFCNEASVELFDADSEKEIIEKNPGALSPENQPDGRNSTRLALRKMDEAREKGTVRFEWVHKTFQNKLIPCEVVLTSVRYGNRELIHASMRYVGDRKKAEAELRKSRKRLSHALEASNQGMWEIYAENGDLFADENLLDILGYLESELPKRIRLAARLIHPNDFSISIRSYVECISGYSEALSLEFRAKTSSGLYKWLSVNGAAVERYPDGRPKLLSGTAIDVTEKKYIEDALKRSEEKYRILLETMNEGLFVLNFFGEITYANKKLIEMSGFGHGELIGRKAALLFKDKELFSKKIAERHAGKSDTYEAVFLRKDGAGVDVLLSASPIFDKDGKVVGSFGIVTDISKQKESETELASANRKLQELSEHMELIREEEKKSISHEIHDELGQILTAIKLEVSSMKNDDKVSIDKIADLVGMVDFAITTVRRISTDLRPVVLDYLGLVPALEWQFEEFLKKVKIEGELIAKKVEIEFPEKEKIAVFRIFQEALTNVARHSKASTINVSVEQIGNEMILTINDNGVGISKTELESPKSFGLIGMKERAFILNADLEIESLPGKGTTVVLKVPLKK